MVECKQWDVRVLYFLRFIQVLAELLPSHPDQVLLIFELGAHFPRQIREGRRAIIFAWQIVYFLWKLRTDAVNLLFQEFTVLVNKHVYDSLVCKLVLVVNQLECWVTEKAQHFAFRSAEDELAESSHVVGV